MSIVYTDPGLMQKQVDFWDQPTSPNDDGTKPDPVLFAQGIYAFIEGLWATTQARKMAQQVVTELSHQVIIRYMPGLRTRMFILYNDPDAADEQGNIVPRRFDIDRIVDPDEMKVELRLLCIERNDGR